MAQRLNLGTFFDFIHFHVHYDMQFFAGLFAWSELVWPGGTPKTLGWMGVGFFWSSHLISHHHVFSTLFQKWCKFCIDSFFILCKRWRRASNSRSSPFKTLFSLKAKKIAFSGPNRTLTHKTYCIAYIRWCTPRNFGDKTSFSFVLAGQFWNKTTKTSKNLNSLTIKLFLALWINLLRKLKTQESNNRVIFCFGLPNSCI